MTLSHSAPSHPAPSRPAISLRDLVITRGRAEILHGISMNVRPGRVTALLGPNGAGKSTTLSAIVGMLSPQSGSVEVLGVPFTRASLLHIGASINGPALYDGLSARDNILVHTRLLGLDESEADRVLELAALVDVGRKKAGKFSTGMRARLAYAIALVGDPEVLILDEPQNGLDPQGTIDMRANLRALADAGRAVLVSSHQLGEVHNLADDLVVIAGGEVRYEGALSEFAPDGDVERAYLAAVR